MAASLGERGKMPESHRANKYVGKIGIKMSAVLVRQDGAPRGKVECCHMSVYSSPSVCMAGVGLP
jgi:hypothetical protein